MSEKIINGIDVSEYFINHYDNSGKLYAVEYKGNPLKLQNAIKRLQEENEELKEEVQYANCPYYINGDCSCMGDVKELYKYKQALEEIRKECFYQCRVCGDCEEDRECPANCGFNNISTKINEVLNDRN